jgi:FtsP/CotA-like multicopper oxidase with cupredoxin domain
VFKVQKGKTYLLRIINAAMNNDYWFSIAKHRVTIVGADGNYLKPFKTHAFPISPGQTTDVLFTADKESGEASGILLNIILFEIPVFSRRSIFSCVRYILQ